MILNTTTALSTLMNPDKILPVAIIETAGTAGRTYNGYKRGGKVEGRERLREETSTAVFWLFGVKVLNKIGDFLGKKAGLDYLSTDLGRDELRAPFLNIPKNVRTKTCLFKFGKIAASALIATALTGFIIPKINHKITDWSRARAEEKALSGKENAAGNKAFENKDNRTPLNNKIPAIQDNSKDLNISALSIAPSLFAPSMEEFFNNARKNSLAFKGSIVEGICKLSHFAENTTVGRLISTDAGMIFGRVKNSRNPFEGFEFGFRDTSSIYFYLFATGNTMALLNKLTGNTSIHPDTLKVLQEHLVNSMGDAKFTPDEFMCHTKTTPRGISDILSEIPFNKKGVVLLDEFNAATGGAYGAKALVMSQMQPLLGGKSVLSKMQVEDILSNGWNTDPEFLKNTVNKGTYGAALDKNKYVSRKTCEAIRRSIDTFTDNLVKHAKSKGVNSIDASFVKKFAKHTTNLNFAFRLMGMAVSCFGIAWLIPKIQYKITEIRTGSKDFPGTADYSDCLNVKNTPSSDKKAQTKA